MPNGLLERARPDLKSSAILKGNNFFLLKNGFKTAHNRPQRNLTSFLLSPTLERVIRFLVDTKNCKLISGHSKTFCPPPQAILCASVYSNIELPHGVSRQHLCESIYLYFCMYRHLHVHIYTSLGIWCGNECMASQLWLLYNNKPRFNSLLHRLYANEMNGFLVFKSQF